MAYYFRKWDEAGENATITGDSSNGTGDITITHADVEHPAPTFLAIWTGAPGYDGRTIERTLPYSFQPEDVKDYLDEVRIVGYLYPPAPPSMPIIVKAVPPEERPESESIYGKTLIPSQKFEAASGEIHAGDGVRSKFNGWSLFKFLNQPGISDPKDVTFNDYSTTVTSDDLINPTANRIINYAANLTSLSVNYKHNDFLATEHFGTISNDYMITLRRFAYPVPDDIVNTSDFQTGKTEAVDITQPDLARAITWLSPALGNDLKDVLKFAYKFKWKDAESSMQELNAGSAQNKRGKLGAAIDGSSLFSAVESGVNGYSADAAARKKSRGDGYDAMSSTYPNHVYGPLNVIKKVLVREQGLEFEQSFPLNFYYDLKGYPGTSPRVAFMDVMSNLLALTYNNAPFWGGGARWVGGSGASSTGKPFGDYDKLKSGDYAGFATSLVSGFSKKFSAGAKDVGGAASGFFAAAGKGEFGEALNALGDSKILDNIIGGGLMKLLGGPGAQGGQTAAAFLTGDPTGQWHVTIGNPMSPILVCGNLALESSELSFEGPLGFEGFPTKMKLSVTLKPARPRDKSEIESMFNAGKGRFYLTPDTAGARNLDDVIDVSEYGNKDRIKSGMVNRISDFSSG
jgi:hypothetical protein|tara:strand:- start:37757 stop:39640 length:1884 start_codon:yes stop_codon:yes gene_type:complete